MERRLPKIVSFVRRVLHDFFLINHGLVLTAAVAFNMMLSLVPLSAVLIVTFSHFFDQAALMETITAEVSLIAPGFTPILKEVLTDFIEQRGLIGGVGLITLLVFSSMAFRVLENAFAIIFHKPLPSLKRNFWVSAMMPYLFIVIIAAGLIALTALNAIIGTHDHLSLLIYPLSLLGLVFLFTLFYRIIPVAKISLRRAFIGGLTATILWEFVRHLLTSYYAKFSAVNVIYGSMATIIIVLLTLEAIALILLLGAQVIADLQRNSDAGVPWHEDPAAN
jgi:membrane protein